MGKISRRKYIVAAGAAAAGVAIGGAAYYFSQKKPPPPTTKINIAEFSHYADVPELMIPSFEETYGVEVKMESVVAKDMRDKMLTTHRTGSSPWDVVPLWAAQAMEMANRGWLVDLTKEVNEYFGPMEDDILGGIKGLFGAVTMADKIYAVPDKTGTPILLWNKALLEKVGLDPEKPYEWHKKKNSIDEFVEYAKACTYVKNGVEHWGYVDQWGYEVDVEFNIFSNMFGGEQYDLTINPPWGEPIMNSTECVNALQWMVDLLHKHKCIDPASTTYDWCFDQIPGYFGGTVAFTITWPFLTHLAEDPEASTIVGKAAYAPNFAKETSASVEGTEFEGISTYAPHGKEWAWKWLKHKCSKEMMRVQAAEHGVWAPIYKSLLTDPDILKNLPEAPIIGLTYEYPHSRFWTPDHEGCAEILRDELHAALRLEKKPKEALDSAVTRIKELRSYYLP